jgi:exopolysaccharide biosynthesis polyprenyl glycosylphosphotransferase
MQESSSAAVGTGTRDERQAIGVRGSPEATGFWSRRTARGWRYVVLRRLLACSDIAAAVLATLSLVVLGSGDAGQLVWGLFYLPGWIVVAKLLGLYDRDERSLRHLTVDEAPYLVLWALVGMSGLTLFLELMPPGRPDAASAVIAGSVAAAAGVVYRAGARSLWRLVTPRERVALIGPAPSAGVVKRKLELFPDLHMAVVHERDTYDVFEAPHDWLDGVDRLVVTPASLDEQYIRGVVGVARQLGMPLTIVPQCRSAFSGGARLAHLAELPVLEYRTGDLSRSTLFLKRALDIAVSAVALIMLSPVFLLIAFAIKLDSRGPVFFSQRRAGQHGEPFVMHKFRTMVQNAEELLPQLVALDALTEPVFKLERDPRRTTVGRSLRRWSLDELPQLFDVLRGKMSLVGPRPEQIELVELYSPEQRLRLLVKPGLTGPMQVYGRGDLGLDERVAVESDYIENLSLGRDLRLIGMTISTVFRGKGAF